MRNIDQQRKQLESLNTPHVWVVLVDAEGSTPQDQGSKMLVTFDGLYAGTVGGGRLEKRAIEIAQEMLANTSHQFLTRFEHIFLKRDLQMICGGSVKLYFERWTHQRQWTIVIFGAGHVAQALARVLVPLDAQLIFVDPRPDWLSKLPVAENLTPVHEENMPRYVKKIPKESFVALMTMGHATDFPILVEILKTRKFPYIGVIGSHTKAHGLRRQIIQEGFDPSDCQRFICPIGLDLGANHLQEIAISIAAQLIQCRDRELLTAPQPLRLEHQS